MGLWEDIEKIIREASKMNIYSLWNFLKIRKNIHMLYPLEFLLIYTYIS